LVKVCWHIRTAIAMHWSSLCWFRRSIRSIEYCNCSLRVLIHFVSSLVELTWFNLNHLLQRRLWYSISGVCDNLDYLLWRRLCYSISGVYGIQRLNFQRPFVLFNSSKKLSKVSRTEASTSRALNLSLCSHRCIKTTYPLDDLKKESRSVPNGLRKYLEEDTFIVRIGQDPKFFEFHVLFGLR
jgi:hypothetical protein